MTAPDLTDPVVVHANMLRGTIAKPTVEQIIHLYGVDALTAALPARGVVVKPLQWEQSAGGVWIAQTGLGSHYSVADSQWFYGTMMAWVWVEGGDEAAKAAAQRDYEARIRAALEPVTPAPDAAIREAALREAHDAIADYPRVSPDSTEAQHYDEQIEYCQSIILALITEKPHDR